MTTRLVITSQYTVFEDTVVELPVGYTPDDIEEAHVNWGKATLNMRDGQLLTDLNVIYKKAEHDELESSPWIALYTVEEDENGRFDFYNRTEVTSGEWR